MRARLHKTLIGVFAFMALAIAPLRAAEVAKGTLDIVGLGLEVDRNPVVTAVDIPANVQTIFGGKTNDEAPPANGLSAVGELTGPGINAPITLIATPGRAFALPALHEKGEYTLQNIRLVGAGGEFLQQAVPSFATITVTDVLKTQVRVRQLTVEELRERGIVIDSRNYEVYEYTFVFGVDQQTVEVPYPVIVDKRTHEVVPVPAPAKYVLPPVPVNKKPPRFVPPEVIPLQLGAGPPPGGDPPTGPDPAPRPSIPAALVVPNGFGVLHQFFAVILQVENGAPDGSNIKLDGITATINSPTQLRIAKVLPAISIGQPVPITDEATGRTFLVAGAKGTAEWTLEALKAGTHSVSIDVRATYQKTGQDDIPLRGRVSTSLVVSDPRFHINFSHPDTVRKDEKYTAYAFVTNLSPQRQHVLLDLSHIPACTSGAAVDNICREAGEAKEEFDLEPGAMRPVPYKLTSKITGKVFAAAGSANDEAVGVSVQLTMGVSASGIPLSPATLLMPHYTQFLPPAFVEANMQFLGLAYSLSTAPLNQYTAKFPRVIKTDVFTRAQQIARAGQRIFITRKQRDTSTPAENRDAFFHLALDLLGNPERLDQLNTAPDLREWDDLRQMEASGRRAGAAMARELEANGFTVDAFAAATSHRTPFLFAYAHGAAVNGNARPYELLVKTVTSGLTLATPAEAESGWTRTLPYSELTALNANGEVGELALVGRWREEDFRITVKPASSAFTLNLIYPDQNGTQLRTDIRITNATPSVPVEIDVRRGARTLIVKNATAVPIVNAVPHSPLDVVGAAQDLHLDPDGHIVTMLLNRPVSIADPKTLRDKFALTVNVAKAGYSITRRNTATQLQIPGAALQDDAKIIAITFDKTLSKNAQYEIDYENVENDVVPRIDNDRPGAILTGKVLRGDNTPIADVLVHLSMKNRADQIDISGADGKFLYEYVPRDIDSNIFGDYTLSADAEGKKTSAEGTVRLPGEVHTVNLQFLGRGRATGQVRYSDGEVLPNVTVTIGSTLFKQYRRGTTNAQGNYDVGDLPVGPLTFSVTDKDGRPTFAANHIRTAGEVITQDLVIERKEAPGLGTVRVLVKRSDTNAIVAGAQVGVWLQGYALREGYTESDGSATFYNVPAGVVSIIAADFGISRTSAGVEVELRKDQTLEQTLVISVPNAQTQYATLEGTITRDDPAAPGDATKDQLVPGAIIVIAGQSAITAAADGKYLYPDLPLNAGGAAITVFDPNTGRRGYFNAPTLVAGSNHMSMKLRSAEPVGYATMRVRLSGARGESVSGYRVISPGYPPEKFTARGSGVYELENVRVPVVDEVIAVPVSADGEYGEQAVRGTMRADFAGQIAITDLRLPGAGTIVVRTEVETTCSTPPCYSPAVGAASLTYSVWDEAEQGFMAKTITKDADPITGLVTFTKVPAKQQVRVATYRNPVGYATATATLLFDGDVQTIPLRLKTIGDVTGRVLSFDRITPVANATVRMFAKNATYAPAITGPDGSFRFPGLPANLTFTIVADLEEDGVYRTGRVDGKTPTGGGPVSDLLIVMREQSSVEGQVVDDSNAPVPLAKYWLRELSWPYRSFGTPQDPLQADIGGRFVVANVFTGPFRITAVSPEVQEVRGNYQGTLAEEGDVSEQSVKVMIGGAGTGAVSITVIDPQLGFGTVENAEVALIRNNARFDFATANENGVVYFDDVPAGSNYVVHAFSKSAGRAGSSDPFTVAADQTASVLAHLEFRGIVSGTLIDPESEPEANQPSRGTPVTLSATGVRTADSTDSTGAFEFIGVPEGNFTLLAQEIGTYRKAVGPSGLFISKLVPEQRNIQLQLERTGTLTVNVYLPNDTGGAGELAPLAEVLVYQGNLIHGPVPYYRGLQGNPVTFKKLLRGMGYTIEVRELGGESRFVRTGGSFGSSEFTKTQNIVLQASGTVEVQVVDSNNKPVEDARVRIRARNMQQRTLYTPASGIVTLPGVPLPGWVSVDAAKDNVTASAGGNLANRTQPLILKLNLGTYATAEGFVDAEQGLGVPSTGTRVLLSATSTLLTNGPLQLETLTDALGAYRFTGIPVKNTTLTLTFIGPDDTTIGATRTVTVADGTTLIEIPRVKLDATPPRVLSIDPPANATSVSPGTNVYITFSEQIKAAYLTNSFFKLIPNDGSAQVTMSIVPSLRPDGTYVVKLVPPAPSGSQRFPLKSNVLYRLSIVKTIQDVTGNAMKNDVGSSFTTVNYTEPAVVSVTPPESAPIPEGTTFRIKFNKAIDGTSFEPGNGGLAILQRLDAYKGNAIENITVSKFVDPADPTTLVVAPSGVAIADSAFYRVTVSGVRDTQDPPNVQIGTKVLEFLSFDTKKPVVTIVSPVSAGESLVSGVLYTVTANVTDSGTGATSTDVAYVDWLNASGTAIARDKTKPFTYSFAAPSTSTPTTYTLKASAVDLSNNTSPETASFTWNVVPNDPPKNVVVTNTPSSIYPSGRVTSRVGFSDEGVVVTVTLELRGMDVDGNAYTKTIGSQNITRGSTAVPFPEAVFTYDVPLAVKDGTATIVATAKDSVNKIGSGQAPLTILADTTPPVVVSMLPSSEAHYRFNQTYTIELQVKDVETGIARAVFTVNNVNVIPTSTFNSTTGVTTFRANVLVPNRNADTRVPIVVTAYDNRNNSTTQTREVIYDRIDDATLPKAAWLTPLDGAVLPSNLTNWQTTLRVHATDEIKVTAVRFESSALASPITLTTPKSGTTDVFEAKAVLTMTAGTPVVITAIVSDGVPNHDVELPITIDPVTATRVITDDFNIAGGVLSQYENESVAVRGVKLYVTTPLTLQNLMLLDGANLSNPEEQRLDLTITDRLFIDGDSKADVSGKGYLGGLRKREDNNLINNSLLGRTAGGTTTGGANTADGSHAGFGGSFTGATNATYGSITEPVEFGAGGGASGTNAGGNGGGAIALRGGAGLARFVVAGNIFANGSFQWSAGAGGSVLLDARALITSPFTRITANGSDEGASDQYDLGGGGGRIAVRVSERFDFDATVPMLQARGGRNGTTGEGATYVDGGAGTVFVKKPGDTLGALIVSARDERPNYTSSTHRNAATPLPGELPFDSITIGPRVLARFDEATTATLTVDPTATIVQPDQVPTVSLVSTTPAANSDVTQGTNIARSVTASSSVGIRSIRTILSVASDHVVYPKWLTSYPETSATITIPSSAPAGTATLKVRVTDRAGRVAESAPVTFNVVTNAAPVIESFDVTPLEVYPNHNVSVSATASDDVAVASISLVPTSPATFTAHTATKPTPQTMARSFTVNIPVTATGGSSVTLTLSTTDDFPGRTPTTATKVVNILTDSLPPSATIAQPAANAEIQESTGATFVVEANATDAEVAVKRVTVTFEGTETQLTLVSGSLYRATLAVPSVEGTDPIAKTLTVKAFDYADNVTTQVITVFIKPLVDATAPTLSWSCSSPGAMFPPAVEFPLRINTVANKDANGATNGVTSVTFAINNGAPINATLVSAGLYEAKYTIPAGTADGTLIPVRVVARAQNGAESVLLGDVIAATGLELATASTIEANDTIVKDTDSYIVKAGGTLTVIGNRRLKNIVLINGGKLVQRSPGVLTVERLYVGCGSSVDVNSLGYARLTTYPGAGAASQRSGGGHIGAGGITAGVPGYPYGSIYRPMEAGGGGHTAKTNTGGAGGGVIRVHANEAVVVDGAMTANGFDNTTSGSGTGAGGSIWITTPGIFGGAGSISARGGGDTSQSDAGTGGGGAIAIEYGTLRGSIKDKLVARAGKGTTAGDPGAGGSIYLKGPQSTYGDLTIDNTGTAVASAVESELPYFGDWVVTGVAQDGVSVRGRRRMRWVPPFVAGNWVRVVAPDGTVRGTWRVESVTASAATRTLGIVDFWTTDSLAYSGYVFYSDSGYPVAGGKTKRLFAARYNNGTWEWDNNSGGFTAFAPKQGDFIVASFTKTSQGITRLEKIACTDACPSINGITTLQLVEGALMPNVSGGDTTGDGYYENTGGWDPSELEAWGGPRGPVFSDAVPPKVTLEAGAVVQPGDTLRGVYRFDSLTLKNARAYTGDLLDVTAAPVLDTASTLVSGNLGAPKIDASKITVTRNVHGAVLTGAAGAITDPDQPVMLSARNTRYAPLAAPLALSSSSRVSVDNSLTTVGTTMIKIPDQLGAGSATTATPMGDYGWIQFRSGRTDKKFSVTLQSVNHGFTCNETISGATTYNVIAGGQAVSGKNGSYTGATRFRIEVLRTVVRWYVDGTKVHEVAATPGATQVLFTLSHDAGAISDIEYDPAWSGARTAANADGSFSMQLFGSPGDDIELFAVDRGRDWFYTEDEVVAEIPANFGVSAVTTPQTEMTSGRTMTATVTLRAPAPSDGALVFLSSGNTSAATVPATVNVAANATSATFTITAGVVSDPADVTITARYGGDSASTSVRVIKDTTAPSMTINAPVNTPQYTEGQQFLVNALTSDADSGLSRVFVTLDGVEINLVKSAGSNQWTSLVTAPYVTASTLKTLTFTAIDNAGNTTTRTADFWSNAILDARAPSVSFLCTSANAMYAANYAAVIKVTATPPPPSGSLFNHIRKVDLVVTDPAGVSTTYPMTIDTGDVWRITYTVPNAADKSLYTLRAIATTASDTAASADSSISVISGAKLATITSNTTISATNTTFDTKAVVIAEGVSVTIAGAHTFDRLVVLNGATVQHALPNSTNFTERVELTAAGIYVACGGRIDTTGGGLPSGAEFPGMSTINSSDGGSHIGRGGRVDELGATYGSVYSPREPGTTSTSTSRGGGVIVLTSSTSLTVDGSIRANGQPTTSTISTASGGSGGSIALKTQSIGGTGTIEADGAGACASGGGGGAIAIEYASGTVPQTFARGGVKATTCSTTFFAGGPGTIYVFGPQSTYGSITIDSNTLGDGMTHLPTLGSGVALSGSGGATLVTDRPANVNSYFAGHWIEIATREGIVKGRWRIDTAAGGINGTTVRLIPTGTSVPNVNAGDRWRGIYRADSFKLRTSVVTGDGLVAPSIDRGTTTVNANSGWPVWLSAPVLSGSTITAAPGTITDNEKPINVAAKNNRTGALSAQVAVAADGSFTIPVSGADGDTFLVIAIDNGADIATTVTGAGIYPLSSEVAAGGIYGELPKLIGFIIEPEVITGGTTSIGTVRIDKPARAGGEVVTLSSANPSVLAVPASVTIPAGTTSVSFQVTTGSPSVATTVFVTATLGLSQTWDFLVVPESSAISSITVDQPLVEGGTSVTGTVTLSAPAPAGGARVELATSNSDLARPGSSVHVSEGNTAATFSITTSRVAATSHVTISAMYGATRSADITLSACSAMPSAPPIANAPFPLWIDDAPPANAVVTGDAAFDTTQSGTGTKSLHFTPASGVRTWSISNATPLSVTPQSELVLHLLVNPCNPPREVLVQWSDGTSTWSASWGETRIDPNAKRFGAIDTTSLWHRLDPSAASLGITSNVSVNKLTISVLDGEAWIDAVAADSCSYPSDELTSSAWFEKPWFENGVPSGSTSGCPAIGAGTTQECVTGTEPFTVEEGDVLFAYVENDACAPANEVMLQFYDGDWTARAFWGADVINETPRVRAGALPEPGKTRRLEIPARLLGLEGTTLTGFAITTSGGSAHAASIGKYTRVNIARAATATQSSLADATNAIDGNSSTSSSTASEAQPWLQLDLGAIEPIDDIVIQSPGLSDFSIFVSSVPFVSYVLETTAAAPGVSRYTNTPTANINRPARYIRVQLHGTGQLQLRELEVWPIGGEQPENLASGRRTTRTTDLLEVDLDAIRAISTIELLGDANDVYLLISDTPFTSSDLTATLQQPNVRAYHFAEPPNTHVPIHHTARYIRVQKPSGGSLSLDEIRVWSQQELLDVLSTRPSAKN